MTDNLDDAIDIDAWDAHVYSSKYLFALPANIRWVGNMPEGVKKGDLIYSCGCIERDGEIWYRAKHWDTALHPNERCPFHKEKDK